MEWYEIKIKGCREEEQGGDGEGEEKREEGRGNRKRREKREDERGEKEEGKTRVEGIINNNNNEVGKRRN